VATHDYSLANQDGASFRSDLNNALAAIVSNNSSSTAPASTFAHQIWVDTTANVIKQRNAANDAWIELWRIDGGFNAKTFSSNVTLNAQSDLRFADSDSSNWVAFQAPALVSSNVTWTLPSADGTADQTLTTNGSGVLSWADPGGVQDNITEGNTSAEVVDTGSNGHFKVVTEGTEALRIDSSQRVGIGTSPAVSLHVSSSTAETFRLQHASTPYLSFYQGATDRGGYFLSNASYVELAAEGQSSNTLMFSTSGAEKIRIDSSGRLLVGTSTARSNFFASVGSQLQIEGTTSPNSALSITRNSNNASCGILYLSKSRSDSIGGNTVVANGDQLGLISWQGADGSNLYPAAGIECLVDGTPGASDMPGRLVFSTTADGASSTTERMRIDNAGVVRCGNNLALAKRDANSVGMKIGTSHPQTALEIETATGGTRYNIRFWQGATEQGRIESGSGSTTYATSSDYRLKENIVPVTDGIERLLQLNPSRFNFIAHPSKTVDGFLAHEVQDVVPEAISGEKDAVEVWQEGEELPDGVSIGDTKLDEDGNTIPKYQGIDQAKLVPLLTAALQEAIGKIETLEVRLTALENA